MTSFINIIYNDIATESIPQGTAFCCLFSGAKDLDLALMLFTQEMCPVYGDNCFTTPALAIHVWYKKFARGRESVDDEERPGQEPGAISHHRFFGSAFTNLLTDGIND